MSSKRRLRRNACEGKKRHKSMDDAFAHARHVGLNIFHPYKCKFCKGFHIGHRPPVLNSVKPKRR